MRIGCAWLLVLFAGSPALAMQWRALGPFGGPAAVVRADPRVEGRLFAATTNALLFRSTDAGDSWSALQFPAQLRATLYALAVDATAPGVVLAGLSGDSGEYRGILRSGDAGETWKRIRLPEDAGVRALAIFPEDGNIIAAGTDRGVYLTRDGGVSWELVSREEPEVQPVVSVAFDPSDSEVVYAGTPHLAWKTQDGGDSWMPLHNGMLNDSDIFSIYVDAADPSRVFAGSCSGVYRSGDAGASWTQLTSLHGASQRTYCVTGDKARDGAVFAGATQGLIRSLDDGKTWHRILPYATRWIEIDPHRSNRVFAATDAGIFRSDDYGARFRESSYGFVNQAVVDLIESGGEVLATVRASLGTVNVFRLRVDAPEWDRVGAADEERAALNLDPAPPGRVYGSVAAGSDLLAATSAGLVRFDVLARRWAPVPGPLESLSVRAICVHPSDSNRIFAASFGAIYGSRDGGRSWSRVAWFGPAVTAKQLMLDAGPPARIFAVTDRLGVYVSDLDRLPEMSINGGIRR